MLHSPAPQNRLISKDFGGCFIVSDPLLELPETLGSSSEALNVRVGKSDLRRIGNHTQNTTNNQTPTHKQQDRLDVGKQN
jgi:hypothetical protein